MLSTSDGKRMSSVASEMNPATTTPHNPADVKRAASCHSSCPDVYRGVTGTTSYGYDKCQRVPLEMDLRNSPVNALMVHVLSPGSLLFWINRLIAERIPAVVTNRYLEMKDN